MWGPCMVQERQRGSSTPLCTSREEMHPCALALLSVCWWGLAPNLWIYYSLAVRSLAMMMSKWSWKSMKHTRYTPFLLVSCSCMRRPCTHNGSMGGMGGWINQWQEWLLVTANISCCGLLGTRAWRCSCLTCSTSPSATSVWVQSTEACAASRHTWHRGADICFLISSSFFLSSYQFDDMIVYTSACIGPATGLLVHPFVSSWFELLVAYALLLFLWSLSFVVRGEGMTATVLTVQHTGTLYTE